METNHFTVLLVEDDLNDIFLVKRAFKLSHLENPITHYWGMECAKPELEMA